MLGGIRGLCRAFLIPCPRWSQLVCSGAPLSAGCAQVSSQQALCSRLGTAHLGTLLSLPFFAELPVLLGFAFASSKLLGRQGNGNGSCHNPSIRKLAWKTQPGGHHVGGKKPLTCPSTGCPPGVPSVGCGSSPTKDLFIDAMRGNSKAGSLPPSWQIIVNILSNPFSKFTNISPAVQYDSKRSGDPAPRVQGSNGCLVAPQKPLP